MISVLLFISLLFFVQVDLIPSQTNQQSFTFSGPEEIFRKAAINSLILYHQQAPHKNKRKKSSGAIPTLIFKPCFSSLENNKIKITCIDPIELHFNNF
jgi:hypothetical protein